MKPNEGRLQTGEHILLKTLELKFKDIIAGISKFKDDSGLLEINSKIDFKNLDIIEIENEVNKIIVNKLPIHKLLLSREDVEKEVDLRKVPSSVKEITIINIEGFDKRPCRDPHVTNTSEIGYFKIISCDKVGANRYRFNFRVDN